MVADKEDESCLEKVIQDVHWEQLTKSKRYKPVKRDDFENGVEAPWAAGAHCAANKFRDE